MEDAALYLLWGALVVAGFAAVLYPLYALQPRLNWRLAPQRMAMAATAAAPAGAVALPARPVRSPTLGGVATLSAWTAVVFGGIGLGLRTVALDHAPFSNLFEFSMAFGFAITLAYVLSELRFHTRLLGAFVMPVAFGLFASALAFPSEGQQVLVPALQNPTLLTIHVSLMILAYAVLAVAFGGAVMHIAQGVDGGRRFGWLPHAERCDEITYRSVLVGFPLLATGVALGALWANDAWGRYWGWDPKETAALVTWLIFAIYLHTRGLQPILRGAGAAARPTRRRRRLRLPPGPWIVILGFAAVLFTYLGVNLWISGLHSYAGV